MHYLLKIPLSPTVHLLSIGLITKQGYQNCEIHSPLVWNLVFGLASAILQRKCINVILNKSFSVHQDIGKQFKHIVKMRKEASSQIVRFMILVRLWAQVFGQDYIGHFKKNAEEIICTLKHLCNRESQYVFQTSKKAYVAQ